MRQNVLILPGFGSSGPAHWQSLWEGANPDFKRVEQRDWEHPVCEEWVHALEKALEECDAEVILVAHSLACLVVAQWANRPHKCIKGALLVLHPIRQALIFHLRHLGLSRPHYTPLIFQAWSLQAPTMCMRASNTQTIWPLCGEVHLSTWVRLAISIRTAHWAFGMRALPFWEDYVNTAFS